MRNIILLIFLFNFFLVNAQQITFTDEENFPIENVIMEFSINSQQKKFTSNRNGIINLKNYSHLKKHVTISHISYQSYNKRITLKDTNFVLKKKNFITDEVFVTGQIKPTHTSETIQKVKLINRKEIDLMAANNLQELLAKEVNMRTSYDNILGSSVSMQGISGQNVKVLIDGVPLIGRLNGNIDLSQINLNNVNKVEIIEGPLSVDFGTDALAGTINLITTKENNKKFSSNYNLFYESVGKYNSDIAVSYKIKSHLLSLNLGRKYFVIF